MGLRSCGRCHRQFPDLELTPYIGGMLCPECLAQAGGKPLPTPLSNAPGSTGPMMRGFLLGGLFMFGLVAILISIVLLHAAR